MLLLFTNSTGGYGQRVLNLLRWMNSIQEFPITLGRDFVGIVKAKGKRVNDNIEIGDKVWGVIEPHQVGALAEYIVVDQKYVSLQLRSQNVTQIARYQSLYFFFVGDTKTKHHR